MTRWKNNGGGRYRVGNYGGSHEDDIIMGIWYDSDGICYGFTLRQGYTPLYECFPGGADNALESDD